MSPETVANLSGAAVERRQTSWPLLHLDHYQPKHKISYLLEDIPVNPAMFETCILLQL